MQLSLTPQQTGELRIVGIAYNLGTSSIQSSNSTSSLILNDGNLTGTTVTTSTSAATPGTGLTRSSYGNTINVRGKQRLEVQGPRLNNTKEEKVNKVYGPDCRLDLVIKQEMPILKVILSIIKLSDQCLYHSKFDEKDVCLLGQNKKKNAVSLSINLKINFYFTCLCSHLSMNCIFVIIYIYHIL